MTKEPKAPVTQAGAVELQETALDAAAGGDAINAVPALPFTPIANKFNPGDIGSVKLRPGG